MTTFVNQSKSSASWANVTKNATTFANQAMTLLFDELLMESGDTLLMESGDKISLENATQKTAWANVTKN